MFDPTAPGDKGGVQVRQIGIVAMAAFAFGFVVERKFASGGVAKNAAFLREEDQVWRMRIVLRVGYAIVFEAFGTDNL